MLGNSNDPNFPWSAGNDFVDDIFSDWGAPDEFEGLVPPVMNQADNQMHSMPQLPPINWINFSQDFTQRLYQTIVQPLLQQEQREHFKSRGDTHLLWEKLCSPGCIP